MCAKDFDEPLVFRAVLVEPLELEARRAERAARRVLQSSYSCGTLAAHIDEILGERADDPVPAGIDFGDVPRFTQRGFDHAAGRCIDYGGDSAGLGVERVFRGGFFHARAEYRKPLTCG